MTIEQVTLVPDSSVEVGPYEVEARLRAHLDGQQIASASLFWRVNAGAWTQMPLVWQGGDVYGNSIPPVATPAQVDYYVEATDTASNSLRWPGPASFEGFRVGSQVPFWSTDFESGPAGWTHATYGDTSNPGDEWELGPPGGATGSAIMIGQIFNWRDPASAFSGTNCWGVDLGNGSNGNYGVNVHTRLRSPGDRLHRRARRALALPALVERAVPERRPGADPREREHRLVEPGRHERAGDGLVAAGPRHLALGRRQPVRADRVRAAPATTRCSWAAGTSTTSS